MGWVKEANKALSVSGRCQVRPIGGSMRGRIESGQLITLEVVDRNDLQVNDVVFIRWKGHYILHLIKEIQGEKILIGNNLGKINGWAKKSDVVARLVEETNG